MNGSRYLKKSTAKTIMVLMVDSDDHQTGLAGLTLSISASKDGGAFSSISPTVTDRGNGKYAIALTTTHTNTNGTLWLEITATGADAIDPSWEVGEVDPLDPVRFGLTALPNAAAAASGGLFTRGTGAGQINQNANGQIDVRIVGAASSSIDRAALAQDVRDMFGEIRRNTAQAGSTTTITLDASASAVDDRYNGALIAIVGGTGAGQFSTVTDYVGSTKVATAAFGTAPSSDSVFVLFAATQPSLSLGTNAITAATLATDARAAIAAAVGGSLVEGSNTLFDLVRLIVGVICGTVADFETDTQAYKSLDGTKTRLTVTTSVAGRDSIVVGNLT